VCPEVRVDLCPRMGEALSLPEEPEGHTDGSAPAPNEGLLLSQLIQLLSQRQSLLLSDLGALLPKSLRHRAKEQGGLRSWLQRYRSLFLVSGQPGEESVTLILGCGAELGCSRTAAEDTACASAHLAVHDQASQVSSAFDEDVEGQAAVQLRGLPYRATTEDVHAFLGEFASKLADDRAVHLVLNRDGRPSGFARVQFSSPEVARQCQEELHLRSMDDRYVEVFLYSERPCRGRQRRATTEDAAVGNGDVGGRGSCLADAPAASREQVVKECRAEMAEPKNRRLLLSMLGVALSPGARSYLKQMDQGLKHFLAQFPGEFSVEGGKGCEYVTYTPTLNLSEAIDYSASARIELSGTGVDENVPASPKPSAIDPATSVKSTPSNWGTPLPGGSASWQPSWPASEGTANAWAAPPAWPMPQLWPTDWPHAAQYPAWASPEVPAFPAAEELGHFSLSDSLVDTGPTAAVRLRGLPFTATEQDVLAFFSQHNIVDRVADGPKALSLLLRPNGRPSGQAVVQMRDRADAELARSVLHGQWMGSRYIEVFLCGEDGAELGAAPLPGQSAAVDPLPQWPPWFGLPDTGETPWDALFEFLGPERAAAAAAAVGAGVRGVEDQACAELLENGHHCAAGVRAST